MHTKDILAAELRKAGLDAMAGKAEQGYYHDFLSPLAMPCQQLATDLGVYANAPSWPRRDEAKALLARHMNGDFDASKDESDAWAASEEGREAFGALKSPRAGQQKIGRLAMRHEGQWWKAYYAMAGTMEGAVELGSIRIGAVEDERNKRAFMDLMRNVVSDIIENETGQRPEWPDGTRPAPEHERAGHG